MNTRDTEYEIRIFKMTKFGMFFFYMMAFLNIASESLIAFLDFNINTEYKIGLIVLISIGFGYSEISRRYSDMNKETLSFKVMNEKIISAISSFSGSLFLMFFSLIISTYIENFLT